MSSINILKVSMFRGTALVADPAYYFKVEQVVSLPTQEIFGDGNDIRVPLSMLTMLWMMAHTGSWGVHHRCSLTHMNNALVAKRIPGLDPPSLVLVDAFRHSSEPGCQAFFLSHFHGDHYQGLTADWSAGPILCSPITAKLVTTIIGVHPSLVRALPFDEEVEVIEGTVHVTLLNANHCQGAALLLFRIVDRRKGDGSVYHLHTGDFRYHESMKGYESLQGIRIDTVLLDTTYSHPRYEHMPQEDAMDAAANAVLSRLRQDQEEQEQAAGNQAETKVKRKTLVLLSAYKLGKEKILMHVARRTGLRIYVDQDKVKVLACLGLSAEDMSLFTTDMGETAVHVVRMGFCGEMWPYFRPSFVNLQGYLDKHGTPLGFTHIHGIIPTGWADGSNWNKKNSMVSKGPCSVQLIPYSEHSNFPELFEFVSFLRPRVVLPTVFEDDKHRDAISKRFRNAVDRTANKRAFLSLFGKNKATTSATSSSSSSSSMEAEKPEGESAGSGEDEAARQSKRTRQGEQEVVVLDGDDDSDDDDDDGDTATASQPSKTPTTARTASACGPDASWSCMVCTFLHEGEELKDRSDCAMCGTARGGTLPAQQQAMATDTLGSTEHSSSGGSNTGRSRRTSSKSNVKSPTTAAVPHPSRQKTMLSFFRASSTAETDKETNPQT